MWLRCEAETVVVDYTFSLGQSLLRPTHLGRRGRSLVRQRRVKKSPFFVILQFATGILRPFCEVRGRHGPWPVCVRAVISHRSPRFRLGRYPPRANRKKDSSPFTKKIGPKRQDQFSFWRGKEKKEQRRRQDHFAFAVSILVRCSSRLGSSGLTGTL